ncbi:MAG: O-antigen ligase family protein [Gammaproteobacteria bacterium]|nr:O-antigen ligase family protein [Gammaproteobacteria bacterium]
MLTDSLQTSTRGLKLSQTVAIISFFLLFPGYLFYHQSVAMGLIPPFAAGLFGYVSLGALLVLLTLLPWNTGWLKKIIGNRYVLWVLAFLFYTSAWTLAHYLFSSGDYITKAGLQSLETIIFWSCLFLIGLILPLEAGTLRWSFFISFIAIFCFLLYFSISTGETMYNARRLYGNTTDVSTYQGYARSGLITLLLLMAVFNSFRSRAFFILGGVFVLYLLISRSDFYAFLALSVVFCIVSGIKQPRYFLLLLLVSLEVFILATPDVAPRIEVFVEALSTDEVTQAPASDGDVQTTVPGEASPVHRPPQPPDPARAGTRPPPDETAELPRLSRQFEVLDFSSSKSWVDRLSLQRKALEQIAENPLMGRFGGHVLREDTGRYAKGHTGRYAHNALSAWVGYGLAGFLVYVFLTLSGFLVPARQVVLKQQDAPLWTFAFMLNFVCLLLIIVSKPVYWPLPALGWGVLAQALLNPVAGRN